ncbi:MAG: hydantoinase/oxoprolinase N-terminal domain-containing protein [Alphaproteobacteria bacterium]
MKTAPWRIGVDIGGTFTDLVMLDSRDGRIFKLSTNTALWTRQQEDIDIDCGTIVDGQESVDEVGERIFRLMLDTASGRATKSEQHGYGQNEFVPWQLGAVM